MYKSAAVSTIDQLVTAVTDTNVTSISLKESLRDVPSIRLAPGQSLCGTHDGINLTFLTGVDGLQLSCDNRVQSIQLSTGTAQRAIFNDLTVASLEKIELTGVTTHGRVQILAGDKVRAGHVEVNGLDIIAADATAETDRPHEYGVYVTQGAFTLWNTQSDTNVEITANLIGLSAGRFGEPVFGCGIFVSGAGDKGGRVTVHHLETGAVYSNGKIAAGTADQITAGVFTVFGAYFDQVINHGPVATYGINDMALDNWALWIVGRRKKRSVPTASGIGFVNFGTVRELRMKAPIETFGQGARGFNVYAGTLDLAEFDRIVTHADGAVGVMIAQPIGRITVRRGIETFGGTGHSLEKGVVETLAAVGLAVKAEGSVQSVVIGGGLKTHGKAVLPLDLHGSIESLCITGGCVGDGAAEPPA